MIFNTLTKLDSMQMYNNSGLCIYIEENSENIY